MRVRKRVIHSPIAYQFLKWTGGLWDVPPFQSATLMVRAIATDDLRADQWLWAVGREIGVGLVLGVTLGLATWLLGFYRGGAEMALVVFLAMAGIVLVSNLIGAGLPFLVSRLRLDPAVGSSPLITSVADVAGLAICFFIAPQILRSTL